MAGLSHSFFQIFGQRIRPHRRVVIIRDEFSVGPHQIDDACMIERVAAARKWMLFVKHVERCSDLAYGIAISGQADEARTERRQINLERLWRIALGVDGYENGYDLSARSELGE